MNKKNIKCNTIIYITNIKGEFSGETFKNNVNHLTSIVYKIKGKI
ncbi:MAG: hypothetical protein ACI9E5_001269 [Candidatus Omnitrophota bacterium]|jgi:hypothetical protein